MEIDEVINGLKKLDLSIYPEKEIRQLLNNIGAMASTVVTYAPGKCVMRARLNKDDERFSKKADFSFRPQKCNKTFQRASTPYKTMFYATAIPDKIKDGELDNMRIIGVAETIPMLKNNTKSGYQKISFGKWFVEEKLNLLAIIHKNTYYHESSFTKELVEGFKELSKNTPKELVEKSLKIQTYLADEFSKKEIRGDYDYMISAIFTEIVTNKGYDGVIYPSVRVDGKGFNIAITPKATKKIGLYVVGECSIYKLGNKVTISNDAVAELDGKQKSFKMIDIPNHQQECLAALGIKSIDELKK